MNATVAAVQGALYLLVLSVNSLIAITRGLAAGTGRVADLGPARFVHDNRSGYSLEMRVADATRLRHASLAWLIKRDPKQKKPGRMRS